MRYFTFIAMAATLLVGSNSFANDKSVEFSCKLDASKAKGGSCLVRGEICFDHAGNRSECREHTERDENERNAELRVRCTNGFRLFDRRAKVWFKHGDLVVKGRDNGDEAKLVIEDVKHVDRNREFDATLEIENDEVSSYAGECRFDNDHDAL